MNSQSIFYQYPLLYIWGLKWIHGANFAKRYRYMAGFVKKGDSVLEPACGPAIMADFLPPGVVYRGFDTNKAFISYAQKRHAGVYLANVLNRKSYSPADAVIVCDVLHHLKPSDRKLFIKNCFLSAKKVFIVCEPGKNSRTGKSIFHSFRKRLVEWSEKDGTNDFKIEHFLTKDELLSRIKDGFGIIPSSIKREIKDFGEDIVAVFYKSAVSCFRTNKKKSISAIVPVFNEEKTVAGVVNVLLKNDLIGEVVCVNDGSADKSLAILKKFKNKIKLINLRKNHGKGFALAKGVNKAKGEIIAFFDADLTNLADSHIKTLLKPILEGGKRAVLGYPSGSLINITACLTGERAYYKKDLFPHLAEIAKTRFGAEIFLNNLFDQKETKRVPLRKLRGLYKYEKDSLAKALKGYLNEGVEIALEISKKEHLLPSDWQIISRFGKITDFGELKAKIKIIKNKKIKDFLKKYFGEYAQMLRRWQKFLDQ